MLLVSWLHQHCQPFISSAFIFFWICPVLNLLLFPLHQHWTSVLFNLFHSSLQSDYWAHHTSSSFSSKTSSAGGLLSNPYLLADVSHLLPLHLMSWPACLIVMFSVKKEANDGFVRRLANLQESSCFHSPHPFEEHSHHLHNRWSQSQKPQRYRSQLNLWGSSHPVQRQNS